MLVRFLINGSRALLEHKSDRWRERSQKQRTARVPVEVPAYVADLRDELRTYLTENRLLNVLSKLDPVTIKDFGRVMGAFSADAWMDFQKDFGTRTNVLEDGELKLIKQTLGKEGAKVVREFLRRQSGVD